LSLHPKRNQTWLSDWSVCKCTIIYDHTWTHV
jgi:hypothetical protein